MIYMMFIKEIICLGTIKHASETIFHFNIATL